jgi:hypothetical protein
MATNDGTCKDRDMAMAILRTIAEGMKPGTQKDALGSVAEWIRERDFGNIPDTPEERRALVLKIKTEMRNGMSDKERRAEAAFYLEGIEA